MSAYHNSNLLYRIALSIWTARKKDKTESANVNAAAGAVEGAANVHKQLLPGNVELEAIKTWQGKCRNFVYAHTLPWDDSGWRIGRVVAHLDFMTQVGDLTREGDALVEAFLESYSVAIEHARFTLNSMFDPSDYPGVEELRSKFRFTIDVSPLPNCEDFRVVDGILPEEVDRLVGIARDSVEQRVQAAMSDAYGRLFTVVTKMATTLQAYTNKDIKKFNDTLVHNISDLISVMPALNITGDPKLTMLANEAQALCAFDLVDLRKTEGARDEAVAKAREVAAMIQAVVNGDAVPVNDDSSSDVPNVVTPENIMDGW